ncbi:MAG TPA: integrin alpha, partial [Myxococcota bacterium]
DPLDGVRKAHLVNTAHRIRAYVGDDGGVVLASSSDASSRVSLRVERGRPGRALVRTPALDGAAVKMESAGIEQRFSNEDDGIEHTIVINEDAQDVLDDDGNIALRVLVGGMTPSVRDYDDVVFESPKGTSLRYSGLRVFDAAGVQQTAWFDVEDGTVVIHAALDDTASFPITIDPLATAPYTTLTTPYASADFASAMAIGDFNHDGVQDLIIGADTASTSGLLTHNGATTQLLGVSGSGLGTSSWHDEGASNSAGCGAAVAAGDVDGVNGDDVLLSCPGLSQVRVFFNNGTNVQVGAASKTIPITGLVGKQSVVAAHLKGTSRAQVVVAQEGALKVYDYNGTAFTNVRTVAISAAAIPNIRMIHVANTGEDDIVVESGRVLSVFKSDSVTYLQSTPVVGGAGSSLDFSAQTAITFAPVDDANVGRDDLIIGIPNASSNAGQVKIMKNNSGSSYTLSGAVIIGAASEHLGSSVYGVDLDGDAHGDIVMCGTGLNAGKGGCRVFPGAPTSIVAEGLDRVNQATLVPGTGITGAGDAPVIAGDFSKQGALDVVLPIAAQNKLMAFDGTPAMTRATNKTPLLADAHNVNENYGMVVVLADIDQDGIDDIIVGAPGFDNALGGVGSDGAVFAFKGGTTFSGTPSWSQHAVAPGDGRFGSAIAVGRFLGASLPPVVAVSAPNESFPGDPASSGRVRLFQAPTSGFPTSDGTEVVHVSGGFAGDQLGTTLANAGTVATSTLGGEALAIGAPQATKTPPSHDGGYVRIYVPTTPGAGSIALTSNVRGLDHGCQQGMGSSIADVGNVDGDAISADDLLLGAQLCHTPDDGGNAFLLTSSGGGAPTFSSWTFNVATAAAKLGQTVAGLGDTNGDGHPDFAVAAPGMDSSSGRIYVFNGVSSGLPSTTASTTVAPGLAGSAGYSMATAAVKNGAVVGHDINGDGLMDLMEGEPFYTGASSHEGMVEIFTGHSGVLDNQSKKQLLGTCANCDFGISVALGNLGCTSTTSCSGTKDAYADALIGEPGLSSEGEAIVYPGQW